LLILTWVPWSEREWIQFLGRTCRQDHAGQYAVFLSATDEHVAAARREQQPGEGLVAAILRCSDRETAKTLQASGEEIARARLMHRLTSRYWTLHKQQKTSRAQDWEWKRLCGEYTGMSVESIERRCDAIIPPGVRIVVDADDIGYDGQWKQRVQLTPCPVPNQGDPGCIDSEEVKVPPKKARQSRDGMASAESGVEQRTYHINDISFFGLPRQVLSAPADSRPDPLLAVCNVLLLRNQIALPRDHSSITWQEVLEKVVAALVHWHALHVDSEVQGRLDTAMDVLQSFKAGLDLDCRFSGPTAFEPQRELCVFELLDISLTHGWVVSPLDMDAFAIVGQASHSTLRQRLADFDVMQQRLVGDDGGALQAEGLDLVLEDIRVIEEAPVMRDFLDRSSSQLTYEGIIRLHESLSEREVAVFVRSSHFRTLLRSGDELYLLCDGDLLSAGVVWERLAAADDDAAYLGAEFQALHAPRQDVAGAAPGPRARGPRAAVAADLGEQQGAAEGLAEQPCRRCGVVNQFQAPVCGLSSMMRCGACGEVQPVLEAPPAPSGSAG